MSNIINMDFDYKALETLSYKTPFFLFSKKKILQNLHEFKKLFPKATIHYAIKANSELGILRILADVGCSFELASSYELDILKKLKVPADKILYGTSVKPASHIKDFFDYGVDRFAFDSLSELEKIAAMAPGSKVYVRAIVNDTGSVFKFSEKFGTDVGNIPQLLLHAHELKLQPYGISFHVGSQASDPKAWANAIKSFIPAIKELLKMGIKIEVLDLGGGYPCKYVSSEYPPTLEEISKNIFEEYKRLLYQPKLILEPGRGIVGNTGVLVISVIARVERKSSTWLFLDAGVYNGLFEAMAYQGSTRYPITCMRPAENSGESLFALAGPTGDSPDVITREVMLPTDMDVGDKLIIHNVGAYSLSVTSRFNGFPKPNVYYI